MDLASLSRLIHKIQTLAFSIFVKVHFQWLGSYYVPFFTNLKMLNPNLEKMIFLCQKNVIYRIIVRIFLPIQTRYLTKVACMN